MEEGNGNPLQYSCLKDPRDGGAWWAAVYGVTQSQECGILVLAAFSLKHSSSHLGLCHWLSGRASACHCRRPRFDPWIGKIPWRRKWLPTPVFLLGKSHRKGSLEGYSHKVFVGSQIAINTCTHTNTGHLKVVSSIDSGNCNATKINKIEMNLVT